MQSKQPHLLRRYLLVTAGLIIMSFGVALSLEADLGTAPTSCIPTVLSAYPTIPLTVGAVTILFNAFLVLLQIVLLRRRFPPIQLLQLVVAFAFGYLTDGMVWLCSLLHLQGLFQAGGAVGGYLLRWVVCLISIVLVGIGAFFEVKANVLMLSGEGTVTALARVTGKPFHRIKVIFDSSLVATAAVLSLLGMHRLQGVREGTVAAALLVGPVVAVCTRWFPMVDRWLENKENA